MLNSIPWGKTSGLYYKNILIIISDDLSDAYTTNVLLAPAFALASVVNYDHNWCYKL